MAILVAAAAATSAWAEEPTDPRRPTRNLFGMTGLMDTPTADMQPDGEVGLTAGYVGESLRNTATFQFLPGVETAFRYSMIEQFGAFPALGTEFTYDRSFDIKVRLVAESERWPAVAIGLQDFLGTGIYSSEYLVATKGVDVGDLGHLRVSGGIGWGRFAGVNGINNPFCVVPTSDRFCSRTGSGAPGGTINFGRYFSGDDMGLFGGIEWWTPIDGLSAKIEYSPDAYTRETELGDFKRRAQVNFGLDYRPTSGIEVGAYYMYGAEIGLRVTFSGNPFRPLADYDLRPGPRPIRPRQPDQGPIRAALGRITSFFDSEPPETEFSDPRLRNVVVHERLGNVRWAEAMLTERAEDRCPDDLARAIDAELGLVDVVTFSRPGHGVLCTVALRPAGEQAVRLTARAYADYPVDWYDQPDKRAEIAEKLAKELEPESIELVGLEIAPTRAQVYISNGIYRAVPRALGRTARALARVMPPSVETFEITPVERWLPVATVILKRSDLEDQVERPDAAERTWRTATVTNAHPVNWSDIAVGDHFPDVSWYILPATPFGLFDPDQPVRFDLSVVTGATLHVMPGLSASAAVTTRLGGNLDDITRGPGSALPHVRSDIAKYLSKGNPAVTRLTGDYVTKLSDDVYGRLTVGLLERMYGGVSGEVLWKPATQNWGLGLEVNAVKKRGFDSLFTFQDYEVVTGHASLYVDTNFHDLSFEIDAGRYLAKDWGATFSVKRRFANGWEIGAFATFTNVPFSEFGEGSFDKGIYLTIPFDWAVPFDTRSAYSAIFRPLTRDGGQRVQVPGRLYDVVEDQDRRGYRRNWESFWQ